MATVSSPDRPVAERWYLRHAALVRITHWINAVCFALLLMSGLQIFNAHPALYVGEQSDFDHPAISIRARLSENGLVGETIFAGHSFDTSGVLGVSSEDGQNLATSLSQLDHDPEQPGSGDWPALAFFLCLAAGAQRSRLFCLGLRKATFRSESTPQPPRAQPCRERGP